MKMKEDDLKGAVSVASKYYNSGQQAPTRKRSLYRKASDLVKSQLYKRRIKKKGKEIERGSYRSPRRQDADRQLEDAGIKKTRYAK